MDHSLLLLWEDIYSHDLVVNACCIYISEIIIMYIGVYDIFIINIPGCTLQIIIPLSTSLGSKPLTLLILLRCREVEALSLAYPPISHKLLKLSH